MKSVRIPNFSGPYFSVFGKQPHESQPGKVSHFAKQQKHRKGDN